MKRTLFALLWAAPLAAVAACPPLLNHQVPALMGGKLNLCEYSGKAVVVVNTASECGFTYQYEGLEALHRELGDKGLAVIGFPCNQFGKQEPGGAEAIGSFCQKNYGVSFKMAAKIDVNGANADPLWQYLKQQKAGILGTRAIKWNFTKFLLDRQGRVVGRFGPRTKPEALRSEIERLL